jgi:protein SCO1
MHKAMTVTVTMAVILAAATAGLAVGGKHREKVPDPQTDFQAYTAYRLRQHLPNIELVNQDGKKLRFYNDLVKGKIVVIQFMFTKCDQLCPMVTPNLVKVQRRLQEQAPGEVKIVSISVDPDHDTPKALRAYAAKFHVGPGWQFLTGRKSEIERLRRELGVFDPENTTFEHMNVVTIGKEPTGQWFCMRALNRADVIAYNVLRLTNHTTGSSGGKPASSSGQVRLTAGK